MTAGPTTTPAQAPSAAREPEPRADASTVDPPTSEPPDPPAEAASPGGGDLRRMVVTLGTNVAVITGLLVYFGWKRADTQARVLGVDESIFGLTTADYVLRSVDALFVPIAVAAFAGLGWVWADVQVRRRLRRHDHWPRLARATTVLAFAWAWLPAVVFAVGQLAPRIGLFGFPLSFGVGVLLAVYALHLRRLVTPPADRPPPEEGWQVGLTRAFVGVIVVLSLFWAITNYATFRGVSLAVQVADDVGALPQVVVYSPERLAIDAPGVTERRLETDPSRATGGADADAEDAGPGAYAFRYDGLRLLDRVGERLFLLSDGFTRRFGVLVVLPRDGDLRYEFVHDRRAGP